MFQRSTPSPFVMLVLPFSVSPYPLLHIPGIPGQFKPFHQGLWFGIHQVPMAPVGYQMSVLLLSCLGSANHQERE
jgi:hypothetical protein